MTYELAIDVRLDDAALDELWRDAATASVFNHPAWWRAATAAFGAKRPLLVVTARRDGVLMGAWPFWSKVLGPRETFARIVEPVGARVTDYVMPLVRRGHDVTQVTAALLRALKPELDARTVLLWSKAPAEDAARNAVALAFGDRCGLVHESHRTCYAAPLAATYAALEASWSKRQRGDVRRQIRRLEGFGGARLHRTIPRREIAERLPYLFQIHRLSWGARTGQSEFASGPMGDFLLELAARLPEDRLHYSELVLQDRPISAHFGFIEDRRILWYKPAFDIAWQSYSPGKIHIAEAARWGIANGCTEIDFMQGTESYKLDWSPTSRRTISLAVSHRLAYPIWAWNTKVRKLAAEYRV